MIEYSCEVSLSLDEAHKQLTAVGVKHEVINETTLGFRKRPIRKAKEILSRCGFIAEPHDNTPIEVKLEQLKEKFS